VKYHETQALREIIQLLERMIDGIMKKYLIEMKSKNENRQTDRYIGR
jgi:hypothetical protein